MARLSFILALAGLTTTAHSVLLRRNDARSAVPDYESFKFATVREEADEAAPAPGPAEHTADDSDAPPQNGEVFISHGSGADAGDNYGSDADAGDNYGSAADAGDNNDSDADVGDNYGSDADAGDNYGSAADAGDNNGSDADVGDNYGSDADVGDNYGSDADAGDDYGSDAEELAEAEGATGPEMEDEEEEEEELAGDMDMSPSATGPEEEVSDKALTEAFEKSLAEAAKVQDDATKALVEAEEQLDNDPCAGIVKEKKMARCTLCQENADCTGIEKQWKKAKCEMIKAKCQVQGHLPGGPSAADPVADYGSDSDESYGINEDSAEDSVETALVPAIVDMSTPEATAQLSIPAAPGSLAPAQSDGEVQDKVTPDSTVQADGTIIEQFADGAKVVTYTNGDVVNLLTDGTVINTKADGAEALTKPDGYLLETAVDGTKTETFPDGGIVETFPDGGIVEHYLDGKEIQRRTDGKEVTLYPDGRTETKSPDGMVETTPADEQKAAILTQAREQRTSNQDAVKEDHDTHRTTHAMPLD